MPNDYKKFLVTSILFLFPIVITFGYFEFQLKKIPNSYSEKKINFENQLNKITVLVLGNSQGLKGINPSYFNCPGFNLSSVSQPFYYDVALSLKYLDKMPNLKAVILTTSYFSFGFDLDNFEEYWRTYFYHHFWDIKYPNHKWDDLKLYSYIALYTPQRVWQFTWENFDVNLDETKNITGWQKNTEFGLINDKTGQERVTFHNKLINKTTIQKNNELLNKFLLKLNEKNISAYFVIMPVYNTYFKSTDSETNKKNTQIIKNLCQNNKCDYFDYFSDKRFIFEDFGDNDHLNDPGAEKLSKIINHDIVKNLCKEPLNN